MKLSQKKRFSIFLLKMFSGEEIPSAICYIRKILRASRSLEDGQNAPIHCLFSILRPSKVMPGLN